MRPFVKRIYNSLNYLSGPRYFGPCGVCSQPWVGAVVNAVNLSGAILHGRCPESLYDEAKVTALGDGVEKVFTEEFCGSLELRTTDEIKRAIKDGRPVISLSFTVA